jgi:hypothetical protein
MLAAEYLLPSCVGCTDAGGGELGAEACHAPVGVWLWRSWQLKTLNVKLTSIAVVAAVVSPFTASIELNFAGSPELD